jgi:ribose 5-phosphate isomerase B
VADSSSKPRIALGADHAGFRAKENIKKYLEGAGYGVEDVGTWSEESVDYPDFARAVGERVAAGKDPLGILLCATGIGVSIVANKVEGIRAALAHDSLTARRAREHNNANVLALGGKIVGEDEAIAIVQEFLNAQFAGGRHQPRVEKISKMDLAREHNSGGLQVEPPPVSGGLPFGTQGKQVEFAPDSGTLDAKHVTKT